MRDGERQVDGNRFRPIEGIAEDPDEKWVSNAWKPQAGAGPATTRFFFCPPRKRFAVV
jgi:hypothetical protein